MEKSQRESASLRIISNVFLIRMARVRRRRAVAVDEGRSDPRIGRSTGEVFSRTCRRRPGRASNDRTQLKAAAGDDQEERICRWRNEDGAPCAAGREERRSRGRLGGCCWKSPQHAVVLVVARGGTALSLSGRPQSAFPVQRWTVFSWRPGELAGIHRKRCSICNMSNYMCSPLPHYVQRLSNMHFSLLAGSHVQLDHSSYNNDS